MPRFGSLFLIAALGWLSHSTDRLTAQQPLHAMPPTVATLGTPVFGDEITQIVEPNPFDVSIRGRAVPYDGDSWTWQLLPEGLIYRSYLADAREPRIASQLVQERDANYWDATAGGRVGILRYGTSDAAWPEGWQFDLEGAAFPRLTLDDYRDLVSVDFSFGFPLTYRRGIFETSFGYAHFSSHLGDEFIEKNPDRDRINYVRDKLVWGVALRPTPDVRLYTEADWAFYRKGDAGPWHFQFGLDYSPAGPTGAWGAPFFALNGRLREEVDFGGTFTMQTGLQWRGQTGRLLRFGVHYLNGHSEQRQFHLEHEEQIGGGLWYDY